MDRALGALRGILGTALTALLLLPPPAAQGGIDEDPGPALTGTPVAGTLDPANAPPLGTGRHLDRLPDEGPLHYRLPRTEEDTTFHVAAMFVGAGDSIGEGLRLEVGTTPGGQGCGSGGVFRPTLGEPAPVLFTTVSTWTDSSDHECAVADDLHLVVGVPDDPADAGRRVELLVYEEPPLASGAGRDLPEAPPAPQWESLQPAADAVEDVVPGTSLASAPMIEDGTYALDLTQGETQVFAVPLGSGQSLRAQLDAVLTSETSDAAVVGSAINVAISGPLRSDDGISFYGKEPDDWSSTALSNMRAGAAFRTGAQTYENSYLNRAKDLSQRGPAMPGLRYVRVTFEAPEGAANLPYTLTVATDGVPSVAPVAPDSATVNVSTPSVRASVAVGTVMVFAVASPSAQLSIPELAVKSVPEVADPEAVA